jgi:hypothetical protein
MEKEASRAERLHASRCTLCRSVHKYITPQVYASFDNAIFIRSCGPAFPLCVSEQRAAAGHF